MTIRLSHAQARALGKLDKDRAISPQEIGETRVTLDALVVAGYAIKVAEKYIKVNDL